jgi:recombinational DNA repair protein RecT
MGLEPDGRNAYLVPYGNECTLIPGYMGLVQLAYRSGEIASIHADVFCEGETFTESMGEVTAHVIDRSKPRGRPLGAYCIVKFTSGAVKHEVMGVGEIEAIRKRSKAGSKGPWVDYWAEMAKKTVFKRASKWLPISSEVLEAFERDDDTLIEQTPVLRKSASSLSMLTESLTQEATIPSYETIDDVLHAINQASTKEAIVAVSKAAIACKPEDDEWAAAIDRLSTEAIESL